MTAFTDHLHHDSVAFGRVGGIMGGVGFRKQEAPNYIPGIISNITMQAFMFVVVAIQAPDLHRKNKAVKAGGSPSTPGGGQGGLLLCTIVAMRLEGLLMLFRG